MFEGDIKDGAEVFDKDGHRIGTVGQVFVLEGTDTPTWVTVHTGLFGMQESFVPLSDATMRGSELVVPYEKGVVKQAPRVAEAEDLTAEQEAHLYRYYEVEPPQRSAGAADGGLADRGADRGAGDRGADRGAGDRGADRGAEDRAAADAHRIDDQPHDERGEQAGFGRRDVDDAGRHAAPDQAAAARASEGAPGSTGTPRLRRRVITEMQTVQVPVQREEIVVEGEGIAADDERDVRS